MSTRTDEKKKRNINAIVCSGCKCEGWKVLLYN